MRQLAVRRLAILALSAAVLGAPAPARSVDAGTYPSKPVRLIVPYPPGGTADVLARLVGAKLGERVGQAIIVENRGGAGGNLAAEVVARAPADGYTLLMGNAPILAINPHLFSKVGIDPFKDFAPITPVAEVPLFLIAHPAAPFNTVSEVIAAAKKAPGKLNYASGSNGSTTHLAMELFKSMAGIDLTAVPYKGSGPALQAMVAGDVPIMFELMPSAMPFIKSGLLKALAVTSRSRSSNFPQLKTVAEEGLPGFEVASWFGVLAPGGTSKEVVEKLHRELSAAISSKDFKDRLATLGAEPMSGGPREFQALIKTEFEKWGRIVKESGARVE
jgi:tripartite-type tricarboxylate transporter receptor subunit TctC